MMRRHLTFAMACPMVWAIWLAVCGFVPALAAPPNEALQTLLNHYAQDQKLPGAVLLVAGPDGDAIVVTGARNRDSQVPVSADTRFYIASSGKMVTATAVLQLVDEGRIRLDQRVAEIIKPAGALARLPNWSSVTVEQLLNHSSGLPDYFTEDFEKAATKDRRMLIDVEQALRGVMGAAAEAHAGAAYDYSNTNFALLGLILQRVDGGSLANSLSRRVFARAGMGSSQVGADPASPLIASAHGASLKPSARNNVIAYGSILGDGPVTTTAADMARFLRALLEERKMLSPATLQLMMAPSRREKTYGLGLARAESKWGLVLGHTGAVSGFNSEVWYYPARQTAIVFLTNGEYRSDDPPDIIDAAAAILFKEPPSAAPRDKRSAVRVAPGTGQGAAIGLCVIGARIEVLSEGKWYPARVIGAPAAGTRCPVHFEGYAADEDEKVPPQRMRARP